MFMIISQEIGNIFVELSSVSNIHDHNNTYENFLYTYSISEQVEMFHILEICMHIDVKTTHHTTTNHCLQKSH